MRGRDVFPFENRCEYLEFILLSPPSPGATATTGLGPPHYPVFTITLRPTTLSWSPPEE
jgi:hypothetical protein